MRSSAMRRGCGALWVCALLALVGCEGGTTSARTAPRNVVLISVDTLRADALGSYGQEQDASPALDALAERGVVFDQCAASVPLTLPSHASIFTGKQPYAHGVRSNGRFRLAERHLTLAERLREAGFATGAETAAVVLGPRTGIEQGFAHFRGAEATDALTERAGTRPARDITRRGIEFVGEHRDEAFFLWLHYFDPHVPYDPPEPHRSRFGSPYLGEVARVDEQVGEFLAELERRGLAERTLVVLTSDHGESLGEHGEQTHSAFVYESTMRIPLILAGPPELPRGARVSEPVRSID
ncbi:MAG: sulfatase, partial [Myxococcales bacterium]|nr:sulfatase [Myxococcales bacterium]